MHGTYVAVLRRSAIPAILALVAVVAALTVPAGAVKGSQQTGPVSFQGESGVVADLDRRTGRDRPSAAQRREAASLDALVRWNRFGTPQSLFDPNGTLASGLPDDPVAATRSFLRREGTLFGLSAAEVKGLDVLGVNRIGRGHAIVLQQRFGGLPAAPDGLVNVAVRNGTVRYASSSLAGGAAKVAPARLSAEEAIVAAAQDLDRTLALSAIDAVGRSAGWSRFDVDGFTHNAAVRRVAVPLPRGGVRPGFQVSLLDNDAGPLAATSIVDAATGVVLVRHDEVDYLGEPKWDVFEASPPLDYSTTDTRVTWCWVAAPDCDMVIAQDPLATPLAWDVDPATGASTSTSLGNNGRSFEKWMSNSNTAVGTNPATARPGRDYQYPWTNQWLEERCNPTTTFESAARNDIDAAVANLFAMHNRMHDWSYRLGFTESTWNAQVSNFGRGGVGNDPEQGNAQAGGIVGGPPAFQSRDNANQVHRPDGTAPITNMYLWQPIAGGFYAPCVDGDYDMSVIAHEYTHLISNRMVAGPVERLQGDQANAMGESWSDLAAVEILNSYGIVPPGQENPFAVGPYVTGDDVAGIRNYGMNQSPLNYSDISYDLVGEQVHADGEIWSAANFDIRQAMIARYGASDAATQIACANGALVATSCPGNRRWIQLVFDAWLLIPAETSYLDARDAMLAADVTRFGGANQDLLWNAFSRRGLGQDAATAGTGDDQPRPGFSSPFAKEAAVTFRPIDEEGHPITGAQLFVGDYEARATAVADTDPATPLDDVVPIVGGNYDLIARANGFGAKRFSLSLKPGQAKLAEVNMPTNLASSTNGATATGDGTNLDKLVDDTEATNWAFVGSDPAVEREAIGKQVTVRLDPSEPWHQISRVQVSALLRPQLPNPNPPPAPNPDPAQNRYSALREFEILVCQVQGAVDCAEQSDFTSVFTSAPDAFPAVAPRPRAPDMLLRSFEIPRVKASYVTIRVVHNQCTGGPDFQGDQDDDPANTTDCEEGSPQDDIVRIAELQVFRT
jgi:extracellular elastinolytic metalloproteinase